MKNTFKNSTKFWIMGSALSLAAFTACSSTQARTDSNANVTPAGYSSSTDSAVAVNTGKNTMEKGAAPNVVNPADDTVERRNANHYQSKWNGPAVATTTESTIVPAQEPAAVTTTSSSADLGASSTGMGR